MAIQIHFDSHIFVSNAAAAFGLNMAVFLLIGKTSALTMNIAGVIKDWLLIALSVLIFKAQASRRLVDACLCSTVNPNQSMHITYVGECSLVESLQICCTHALMPVPGRSVGRPFDGYSPDPGSIPWNIREFFGTFFGYIRHAATPETPALSLTKSVLKFRVVC